MYHLNRLIIVSIWLMLGNSALADTVNLDNGDRLSGEVIKMADGVLVFKATYAGEIEIPWDAVVSLTTDTPITAQLVNDSQITGQAVFSENGEIQISGDDVLKSVAFDVENVTAINPPTAEELAPKTKYSSNFNVGITAATGNADTQQYHFDGEFNARGEQDRYAIGVDFNRGEEDGETIVDNWTVYTNYDYFLSEKVFWNNTITLQQNDLQELNLRTSVSSGIGYQFHDTDDLRLSATIGIGYLSENFEIAPSEQTIAGRWGIKYEHQWFDWLRFFHDQEGLVSVEDTNDFVIRSRTGFRYPISKRFSGTAQINFNYDNSPSPGTEKEDLIYILSLGYLWE